MKILDRYLVIGFFSALIYCLALICLLFVVVDGFTNLDDFLKKGSTFQILVSYYLYLLPTIIVQVAPVASLVAILYTLGNHNRHNELVAMKAAGISGFHILSPYFFMGILISFSVLLVNEVLVPKTSLNSASIMEGLIQKGRKNLNERSIQNVTLRTMDNRIIFAREFEVGTQTLYDVVILEDSPFQTLKGKITAVKGRYENGQWVLSDAMQYQMNRRHDIVGEPVYSKTLAISLDKKPEQFVKEASRSDFLNSQQMREYIRQLEGVSQKLVRKLSVELHYKIAFPFTSLIVMIIGAPLAMKSSRGGVVAGFGAGAALVFLYYGIQSICLALGKGGYLPPFFAAWFSNLLFGLIGVYLIKNTP